MAANAWLQPKFIQNHVGKKLVNYTSDTFNAGLIASGALAARGVTEGYEFVSDLLANNGSALTEVSTVGTGYSRQGLVTVTYTLSGLVITFNAANPEWNPATFSTLSGWIHDETASSGTDATRPLLCIFDWGGTFSPSAQPFIIQLSASGIFTDTVTQ